MISSILKNRTNFQPNVEVFGISGSPRKNGNSDIILKTIISGVSQENISSDTLNLTNIQFQGCIGCERCRKDKICTGLADGMSLVYDKIISSKGLILVSPTHNYNITSWMKAFIDRLYCFYNFENDRPRSWSSQLADQDRKAVIAAICEQETAENMGFTIEAMEKPLEALGYEIIGKLSVFKIFDKAKVKHDQDSMEKAYELGKKLAQSIK
jgi:multimeric flavodoxin WrbA